LVESRYSLEAFTQGYVKLLRGSCPQHGCGLQYVTEPPRESHGFHNTFRTKSVAALPVITLERTDLNNRTAGALELLDFRSGNIWIAIANPKHCNIP